MSLEKSFVDQVAHLAAGVDPRAVGAQVIQVPVANEIFDHSHIVPKGKVLIKNSPEIKPEEFDWNQDLCEDFDSHSAVVFANQGIDAVFADVIVPEVVQADHSIDIVVPVIEVPNQEQVQEPLENSAKMSLDQVWSGDSMFDDEMRPVNPFEVEGEEAPESPMEVPEVDETEMDLLKFVLDKEIQPDDPEFLEFVKTENNEPELSTIDLGDLIGPSTSTAEIPEVKIEPEDIEDPDWTTDVPKKRGRGRPRIPRPYPEPPKRPRGRPPTASTVAVIHEYENSSALSEEEQKLVKYRRMRDLNNAASKRCRVNRKLKFDRQEQEVDRLQTKNVTLKAEVENLEAKVEKAKKLVFALVQRNNRNNVNLAQPEINPNVIEGFDLDAFVNAEIDKH